MDKKYNPLGLSYREIEICKLICDGLLSKQIASNLGIDVRTVEKHRQHINRKLGAKHVANVVAYTLKYLQGDKNG